MRRLISRSAAFVLATTVVFGAALVLVRSSNFDWIRWSYCDLCFYPTFHDDFGTPENWGWVKLDTGAFSLYSPRGSVLHRSRDGEIKVGEIVTPGFTLTYTYGPGANTGTFPEFAPFVTEHVRIDGRDGIIVKARYTGERAGMALVIEHATIEDGRVMALAIVGEFRDARDRDVAEQVLQAIKFEPRPPQKPVKPPSFDIAPDPA